MSSPDQSTPDQSTSEQAPSRTSGTTVAAILTQVATAEALAAACAIGKHVVDAVPSPIGAYAVLVDPSGDRPAELASAVSGLVKTVPLILFEATDGHITASQWLAGVRGEDLPAALVLDGAPHEFEDVLLGSVAASEVEGAVSSKGMSRWKAARSLAASRRAPRGRR
ncbi:hypothetical protein Sked_22530 [Sanguibacter keddieii DSM 10542]|uniref:Uncharacterized protein n=1 Tax=Sanguibacter keddieii (strain ATCC 51767 / DSM 10542 / NCFB 3025 / ST-74) TaxID=446469 RepID=D1BIJ1_SANKS|nr:hypothetical protein [Sanguibacter keddieii]ACZ22168.1 hypothetical protein Sked_22530 [Sanguibacter keddieii DSM 10542]